MTIISISQKPVFKRMVKKLRSFNENALENGMKWLTAVLDSLQIPTEKDWLVKATGKDRAVCLLCNSRLGASLSSISFQIL